MTLALAAGLAVAACGTAEEARTDEFERTIEEQLPSDADVEIDADSGALTIEDDLGSFTSGDDLARPDWLAEEVPLPAGFEFDTYLDTGGIRSARGRLDADPGELLDFYRSAFESLGWEIDAETLDQPSSFFQILTTTLSGAELDVEYVQGSLAFVIGRARPGS